MPLHEVFPSAAELERFEPQVAELLSNASRKLESNPEEASQWGQFGKLAHAHELLPNAVSAYRRASELEPSNFEWFYLAALAIQYADPQQAIVWLESAETISNEEIPALLTLGRLLQESNEHDRAHEAFSRVLRLDSNSAHALVGIARHHIWRQEYEEALTALERARSVAPKHGAIYSLLTHVYSELKQQENAERAELQSLVYPKRLPIQDPYLDSVEAFGASSGAIYQRALKIAAQGQLDEAERLFRETLKLRSGFAEDYTNLGVTLAQQRKFRQALDAFSKAKELAPSDIEVWSNLGFTYLLMGNLDRAEETLATAVELDPAHAIARFNLASVFIQQRNFDEAIEQLQTALKINPGLLDARYNLGAAYATVNQWEQAIQEWELLVEIGPPRASIEFQIGSAYMRLGKHDAALEAFMRGRKIDPRFQRAIEEVQNSIEN